VSERQDDLERVADEARKVMHTVHHGYREDIDFRPLDAALEALDDGPDGPPCPRCGKPTFRVLVDPVSKEPVWGHDCVPL